MANDENLKNGIATQFKAGEEQAKIASKGGIASGVARRKKGAARRYLQEIMALKPVLTPHMRAGLISIGVDPESEHLTNEFMVMIGMMQKAQKGDVKAARLYLEMLGEDPRTVLEEKRLKIQKEAVQALKDSDGFMDALKETASEVFEDGFDTPDGISDSE